MKAQDKPKSEMPDWIPRATFTVLACIFGVFAGIWLAVQLQDLLAWIVIALFISFALEPLTNRLQLRGWKRGTATALILAVVLGVFLIFLGSMVPLIVSQVRELIQDAPRFVDRISDFASERFGLVLSTQELIAQLTKLGSTIGVNGSDVASNVIGVGGRLAGGIFQVLTVILFTFYFVVEGPVVRRKAMALMPAKQQKVFLETWEIAIEKMGGYLYVRLILAGLTALSAFIVMSVARVPFALPLALWMGMVSQFIPVVGTYFGAAVPLLVAILENPWSALAIAVYVVLYQQIENYYISPKLTARTMQLHPAVAIGSAIAGATLYGAVGAFLALPAAAILQVVVGTYIKRHEVVEVDPLIPKLKATSKKR